MIEVLDHANCKDEFDKNVDDFLRKSQANVLTLDALDIENIQPTGIEEEKSPEFEKLSKDPVYVDFREIGSGGFGNVWIVGNAVRAKCMPEKSSLEMG